MPTSAVTGTRSVRTAAKTAKTEPEPAPVVAGPYELVDGTVGALEPTTAADHPPAAPADPNGNGLVQVVTADGRHVNVDGSADGWVDEVRALDPKHPAVRDA